MTRLGDHIDVLSGFPFDSSKFGDSGDYPLVRIRDVVPGTTSTFYSGIADPAYLVDSGDLLVGMDGNFNRATWHGGESLLNQRVCRIKARQETLDQRYLFHFLPAALRSIEEVTSFATVKHLSVKTIREIAIDLPSISEQRRIAAILDQADDLQAQRRRALSLLDELADAIFDQMFDIPSNSAALDSLPRLEQYASQITDGEHQTPRRAASGNLLLSARNVQNGFLDLGNVDYVDDVEFDRISKRCRPMRGDILISCSGSVGRVATVATNQRIVLVRSVAMIRPKDALLPIYLERFLRSPSIQREIVKRSRSSAQANLFQGPIRDLPVLVPSLDQQREFSRSIDAIEQAKLLYQADLTGRDQLFASLQHRVFSGQN